MLPLCAGTRAAARWSESVIDDEDCHLRKALLAGWASLWLGEPKGVGFTDPQITK
jgi:hypothetical protein